MIWLHADVMTDGRLRQFNRIPCRTYDDMQVLMGGYSSVVVVEFRRKHQRFGVFRQRDLQWVQTHNVVARENLQSFDDLDVAIVAAKLMRGCE